MQCCNCANDSDSGSVGSASSISIASSVRISNFENDLSPGLEPWMGRGIVASLLARLLMGSCVRKMAACLSPNPNGDAMHQDLSAFSMPLLDQDGTDVSMDSNDRGRARSSSGSSTLKGLLGKSRNRNKSSERNEEKGDKEKKEKDSKVKTFLDNFRPRSKSDVSGMKRPGKKITSDRSMDESTLAAAQANHRASQVGSQEVLTPMGQILEGQVLNVPESDRSRHKSGPGPLVYKDGFMSKFRGRSNSDSKPMRPRKPLTSQKSLSPPGSPRLEQGGVSPLRLQSGEPRSAPPGMQGMQRLSLSNDHTHAIIYHHKPDQQHRSSIDNMEIEDLDANEDQVFAKFMRAHKCYDLIPTSAKLVIFDTQLNVKKAFFALVYNGVRSAPLWDSEKQDYVGMLTITDFINILKRYYKSPESRMDELEDHRIADWREVLKDRHREFVYTRPDVSLFEAVERLVNEKVHRLPVIDENTGNALYILTHKRILRFLYLYLKDLPRPSFMGKTLKELNIGTFENVITVSPDTPLIRALNMFAENRISALPVVDASGQVTNIYAKFDVINLAAEKTYNNLDISLSDALKMCQQGANNSSQQQQPAQQTNSTPKVATCHSSDTLSSVIETIVKAEVHRLIVTDESGCVEGIVSLSDILNYIVLRPMGAGPSAKSETPEKAEQSPEEEPIQS